MELYLLDVTIRGTVATIAALALERLFAKQLTAGVRRCMWFAVMALFVVGVPFHRSVVEVKAAPAPIIPVTVERQAMAPAAPLVAPYVAEPLNLPPAPPPVPWWSQALETVKAVSWREWLLGVWAFGFALALARLPLCWLWLARRVTQMPEVRDPNWLALLDTCRGEIPTLLKDVRLVDGGNQYAPSLFGFLKPVVILPLDALSQLSQERRRFTLLHELCHLVHHDTRWSVLGYLPLAAQWFNPFCHLAYRRFRGSLETSADKLVLELSGAPGVAYGEALLDNLTIANKTAMTAIGIAEDKNELKRRILMIGRHHKQRGLAVALLAFAAATGLLAVAGGVGAELKPLQQQARDKPDADKPQNIIVSTRSNLYGKSVTTCDAQAFEAAKGKIVLAGEKTGDFLCGTGFLRDRAPALLNLGGDDAIFCFVVATLDAKPVGGGAGKRVVCAFPLVAFPHAAAGHTALPSNAFKDLLNQTGEYELSIKAVCYRISGEELIALGLADEVDGGKKVSVPDFRQFSLPAGGKPDWPLLDTLRVKYPHIELSRDYGRIKAIDKIPEGFFKAVPPTPEMTASIAAGLTVTYDSVGNYLKLRYRELPCGVLAKAEFQLAGESKWREWGDVAIPAATKGSLGKCWEREQTGKQRIKVRLTPLSGNQLWSSNSCCTLIKEYYGGAVETGWLDVNVPAKLKLLGKQPQDKPNADKLRDIERCMGFVQFQKDMTACDARAFEAAKGKIVLAGEKTGDFLRGAGFLHDPTLALRSAQRVDLLFFVVATLDAKPVGGGAEKRVVCSFPVAVVAGLILEPLPSEAFEELLSRTGEYELSIKATCYGISGEDLNLAGEDGGDVEDSIVIPRRLFSLPAGSELDWPLLDTLREKYPHITLSRDYGRIKVFDKIPDGFFKAVPPSPGITANIAASLTVTYDGAINDIKLHYRKLPCGVLSKAEFQLAGENKWREWGDVALPAATEGSWRTRHIQYIEAGKRLLKVRLTPLSGNQLWRSNNDLNNAELIKEYYGGVVETGWLKVDFPADAKAPPRNVVPQPIAPSPAMDAAIKRAVLPKLQFQRQGDGSLELLSGVDSAPCDLAFTVYGKRLRGSGDKWEAFSSFARPRGKSTLHGSSCYDFFSGLEGGKTYKFKFKLSPNKDLAAGGEAEGMPGYYNGEVETDWVELDVPPFSFGPLNGCSGSSVALDKQETVRDDALFNQEWQSFKVTTNYGGEYWIGAGGFLDNHVNTWPFKYQPEKPGAFCLRVVELRTTDAKGQTRTAYQLSDYRLYHNTGFPLYQLDGLFPEPGDYQFGGKLYFLSMSGDDLVKEDLAVKFAIDCFQIVTGSMAATQAAPLLESLKRKYPCHSMDMPGAKIKALRH